ncbi:hypothetical protein DZF95_00815 [Clavibacter michiganensis]|nr:hypothetical protein DZF95_00815 [Clavibacter michiganensis]
MTTDTARAIVEHVSARVSLQSRWALDGFSAAAQQQPNWADPVLERVAAVISDVSDIEYVSGVIAEDDDQSVIHAAVVVITADLIVSATFTTPRNKLHPEGSVTVWLRAAVVRVSVDEVRHPEADEPDPRRQKPAASVTMHLRDDVELLLPASIGRPYVWDTELYDYLPRLLKP